MSEVRTNYIYLKSSDWSAVSRFLKPEDVSKSGIVQAYKDNANRLRSNLSAQAGSFKIDGNFIKNVAALLDFSPKMKNELVGDVPKKFNEDFFQQVSNFIKSGLGETQMASGKTNLQKLSGGALKSKKMEDFNYQDFVDTVGTFNNIYKQILDFNTGFKQLAALKHGVVGYIDNSQLKKTTTAMQNLKSFLKKYHQGGGQISEENFVDRIDQIKSDISVLSNNIISNLRGQLLEYLDYLKIQMQIMASTQVKTAVEEIDSNLDNSIIGNINFTSGAMTGDEKVLEYSTNKKYVSKSDNTVSLQFINNNGKILFSLDLGISDKAYNKGRAGGKRIANSLPWGQVFDHTVPQPLTESQFQYYYANLVVFDPEKIRTPKGSLENKYLAAKAAAFLIAGVEGGSISQAYFVRYGDTIEYIPDLLEKIATDGRGNFGIASLYTFSDEGSSSKKEKTKTVKTFSSDYGGQIFQQQDGPTPEDRYNAAHERVIRTLGLIREKLKFDAYR